MEELENYGKELEADVNTLQVKLAAREEYIESQKEEKKMITITVTTEYNGFWQLLESSWSGALDVLNRVQEEGRTDEAMERIAEYAEMVQESTGAPPEDVQVNDFIWFDLPDEMNLYGDVEDDE